jgi:hypothetical protein
VKNYYLLEVLDGIYFVQFKVSKDSLVYSVDQEEAWKTSNLQAAQNMKICLMRIYNVSSKVVVYDQFPINDGGILFA